MAFFFPVCCHCVELYRRGTSGRGLTEVLLMSPLLFFSLGLPPLEEKTARVFITGVLGVKNNLYA